MKNPWWKFWSPEITGALVAGAIVGLLLVLPILLNAKDRTGLTTVPISQPSMPVPIAVAESISASDEYARSRGYRNWNDWVAHRPKNKNGKVEEEGNNFRVIQGALPFDHPAPVVQAIDEPVATDDLVRETPEEVTGWVLETPVEVNGWVPTDPRIQPVDDVYYPDASVEVRPHVASVPEPPAVLLLGTGLLMLGFRRRAASRPVSLGDNA